MIPATLKPLASARVRTLMKDVSKGAFGPGPADTRESLLIAQNLARLYADVLEEPLPADLARLIGRLQKRVADQADRSGRRR
jgi:hypothetical protein